MVRPGNRDGRQGDEFRSDGLRSIGRRGGSPTEALQPQRMPPPPVRTRRKPREGILSIASGVLSFVLVVAIAAAMAVSYAFHKLDEPGPLDQDKIVFISRGTGTADAIEKLEAEKVIDGGWLFNLGLKMSGRHIKAGEYRFTAHASARQVMATLTEGKPLQHTITLPEGLTSQQIVQRLKDLKDEDGNELLTGDTHLPPEGSLMPNTYKFARGDSRESILKRMAAAQRTVLDEIWKTRDPKLPIRSSYDLVTLASIVEKETGKADERPMVAGVFVNRLNRHMKLQSDPTIIYGLVGGQGSLGRPLRKSEIEKATPYNTYSIEGLPPGPIANPGRAAMEAVAQPAKTKALYFVADGTGGHAFAETIDQHLKNVARWRQIEKEAKDKSAPDSEPPPEQPPLARPPRRTETIEPVAPDMIAKVQDVDDGDAAGFATTKLAADPLPGETKAKVEPKPDPRVFKVGSLKVDLGPAIDQRGWSMDGVDLGSDEPSVKESLMGQDPPSNGSAASYPLSPGQLADLRARQKRFASPGDLVPDAVDASEAPKAAETVAAASVRSEDCGPRLPIGKRPASFDASEGTRLDPMRNKTFDLNSVKIVPDAAVELVPVFGSDSARARVASLAAAADGCPFDTRSAERTAKPPHVQLASLSGPSNGFDASEGTPFDPLRNHSFDLTTAQSVPGRPRIFEVPADLMQALPDPPATVNAASTVAAVARPGAAMPIPKSDAGGGSHGFDASEGTRLDPLRDKTFDLNSAQTVPTKTISFDDPGERQRDASRPPGAGAGTKKEHGRRAQRARSLQGEAAAQAKSTPPVKTGGPAETERSRT